ncbi:hypothetical protein [Taibaiella koreensis]|uniref:hypothetical protein n=1 Tax=Taibaiella koreensis TaxID=1268548 RepID=UPI000E59D3DC|nr:hypothetical protein [Taibaiella koreensis]
MILHSHRTYMTSLSEEATRKALTKIAQGLFNPYRLDWPIQDEQLRFRLRSRWSVAEGVFDTLAGTGQLTVSYKPKGYPLLINSVFAALFLIATFQTKRFTVNGHPVSYGTGIMITCAVILAFTALHLLIHWWQVTQIRESVETALKLKS